MKLCGKFFKHLYPQGLLAVLDLVLAFCCRGAGSTRVWEDVDESWSHNIFEKVVSLHEQFVSLAWESYDYVNSKEYFWTTWNFAALSDVLNLVSKGSCVISASHFAQDGVAA